MHHTRRLLRSILIVTGLTLGTVLVSFLASRHLIPRNASARRANASQLVSEPVTVPDVPTADILWLEGNGSPIAPTEFPVKANQRSGIFHLPADLAYGRTVATRYCRSADAAEADGYRHARR